MDKPKAEFPGVRYVDDMVQAYVNAWKEQSNALSTFWTTITSDNLSMSSWIDSYSQLLSTYGSSVQKLVRSQWSPAIGFGPANCPVIPFVISQAAEGADPVEVVLPSGTKFEDVKKTPPVRVDTEGTLPDTVVDVRAAGLGTFLVGLTGLKTIVPKAGQYSAIVYDSKAPPPFKPLAVVLITFLPT